MTDQPQQEIHDQIGKLKTDLFKCIGTIESIQSKCRSRPAPSTPEYTLEEVIKIDKQIRHAQQVAAAQARNQTLEEAIALDWDPIINSKEKIVDALKSLRREVQP